MAAELAKMYVSIIPSFQGGTRAIESQMGPSLRTAGVRAGREFSEGFSRQEISAANVEKFTAQVATASAKLATVRQKEEDAAGAVRVAEAKLAEVRAKGNATASQLLAAEERAAAASRRLAAAQTAAQGPVDALARAQRDLETATEEAGRSGTDAATTYARGWAGLKAKMGDFIRGSVQDGADSAVREASEGGERAGNSFATAFKGGLATLATAAGLGGIGATFMGALDADMTNDKLAASLGLDPAASKQAGAVAGKLYAGAYGDSLADASSAVGAVMSSMTGTGAPAAAIEELTAKALNLAAGFGVDVAEASKTAGILMKNGLAKDGTEAMDLITDAMQKVPAGVRGEIFPVMDEYSKHFKTLGIDGTTAFGIVKNASQDGAIGMDKIGDSLKEFTLKAVSTDKPVVEAFESIGLSAAEMQKGMAEGGEAGQAAFTKTIAGLQGIEDPALQAQTAIALFGTPLEDLGTDAIPAFLGQLDPMGDSFDSTAGAADRFDATLNGNTKTDIETFKRGLEVGITQTLNDQVIPAIMDAAKWIQDEFVPALQDAGKWIQDNAAWLVPLAAAVGAYVLVMGTMSILATVRGWVAAAAAAQWGLNAAMAANPIGIVVALVAGLVAGLVWFFTQTELGQQIWKTAWDGMSTAISWVWENVIKPVFTALTDFVTKTIPQAFTDGVAFVKTIWEGLQEVAKAPIRFVVNTVINDGLIGAFNTVSGFLGGPKLERLALPPGFADGGYTGSGGKYQPAGIVHAGEVVWSQDDIARWGGVGVVEGMRKAAGYADGGRVSPLKTLAVTQGYNRIHKGIDYAAAVGTPVFATQDGVVSHAGPGARAPGVWGGNEVHIAGGGIETWFAHLSRIMVGLGQQVRAGQQIALSGNTGISSGPHLHFGAFAGGWPNDINPSAYLGGAGVPDGGVGGGGGGFNPITGIIDGLMGQFKTAFPAGGPLIDMVGGVGKKILTDAADFITGIFAGSRDGSAAGVRPTLFDGGGWLENTGGAQIVQHNKARPDAVLSNAQWATMSRIAENAAGAGRAAAEVHIHPSVGMSEETIGRVAVNSLNYQLRMAR